MVDVAAVAAILLTRITAPALRRRLLAIHPDGDEHSLRLLLFVIALHDLGKMTPAFQVKLDWAQVLLPQYGFDLDAAADARHHGDVGLGFVLDALCSVAIERRVARALARAVTAHHGEFPTNTSLERAPGRRERGASARWDAARTAVVDDLRNLFGVADAPSLVVHHAYVALLAGFTSVVDWIGSMDEVFTYEPPQASLDAYWPLALGRAGLALDRVGLRDAVARRLHSFAELFPAYQPWPLHLAADAVASTLDEPSLIVIEAPMGEGKTEASLLLADAAAARLGQHGLYIGLPTQATANQMLGRVETFLKSSHGGEKSTLVLAHGEADLVERFQNLAAVYDRDGRRADGVRAEAWFRSKKRTLLAEYAVGTIDQALLGVMRTGHAFVRLYGLAGKTVVLDEVHAYDTYTSTLLDRLVEWLAAMGSTVLLLSATLPSARRASLVHAYRRGAGATTDEDIEVTQYPRISVASRRGIRPRHFLPRGHSVFVTLERHVDDIEAIAQKIVDAVARGGCAGWICNTVARAQEACDAVRRLAPDLPRLLLHSRLLPEERAARERRLERWLGPEKTGVDRPRRCVVIGTQVLEQSLDVDFDLLFTDLAPVDLLLQRAGRLHRHTRSNRAAGHHPPRLVLVHPDGPWESVSIDAVAIVYEKALVRRTLRALASRVSIVLPDDIEGLVEEVYRDGLPTPEDALFEASVDYLGASIADRQHAESRLMPRPSMEDDPFGNLRVVFDDDEDPGLHEQLKAKTRLGPESVDIVCLIRRGSALYVDETDPQPINLESTPDYRLIQRLVRRSIGVTREGLVRELLRDASYQPKTWSDSALLRYRRAVAFENGVAVVGGTQLTLDPEFGLLIKPI
jgi:CRISPR-associated endonuclease/helicase Cas3